jgi:hypothetical protein
MTLSKSYWHYLGCIITILLPGHWMDRSTQKVTLAIMVGSALWDDASCLALALTYTHTRGSLFMLQAFFGLTAMPLVTWMQYRKRIIIKILQNLDNICIKMPTTNHLFKYSTIIKRAYPVLSRHYAVCDGLKLFIEKAGIASIQGT